MTKIMLGSIAGLGCLYCFASIFSGRNYLETAMWIFATIVWGIVSYNEFTKEEYDDDEE